MNTIWHVLHVVSAGAWLGGVLFTTFVVSPALAAMKWPEPERVLVRSVIGRHYARLAGVNLTLLILFAFLDGWVAGFNVLFYAEYALLAMLLGLVAAHGAYFGRANLPASPKPRNRLKNLKPPPFMPPGAAHCKSSRPGSRG